MPDLETPPERLQELAARRQRAHLSRRRRHRLAALAGAAMLTLGAAFAALAAQASGTSTAQAQAPLLWSWPTPPRPRGHCPIPERYRPDLLAAARQARLSPQLLAAVVFQESRFKPKAHSQAGALGLMQLMPQTARELEVHPLNPRSSLVGGSRYLRQQLDRFGNLRLALAAYNAGPTAVARFGGVPPYGETEQYVKQILARSKRYRRSVSACSVQLQ